MAEIPPIRFSVVIPLYNKESFVRASLESVLGQSHDAFEVIVVDDGSTDASIARIEEFSDPRIRIVRQENAGPGAARNRGIAEAEGEWVALLDADDLWLPNHLETLAQIVAKFPQVDLAATSFKRSLAGAATIVPSSPPTTSYITNYFREHAGREVVSSSSVALRRSAFLSGDGFGDKWPGEDSEFWARFALDHVFAVSRRVTVLYLIYTGGIIHTGATSDHDRTSFLDNPTIATLDRAMADSRYSEKHDDIARLREYITLGSAKRALYRGDRKAAQEILSHAMRPLRVRALSYLLLSHVPSAMLRAGIRSFSALTSLSNK